MSFIFNYKKKKKKKKKNAAEKKMTKSNTGTKTEELLVKKKGMFTNQQHFCSSQNLFPLVMFKNTSRLIVKVLLKKNLIT